MSANLLQSESHAATGVGLPPGDDQTRSHERLTGSQVSNRQRLLRSR